MIFGAIHIQAIQNIFLNYSCRAKFKAFFYLEELPRYKSHRPICCEVSYFRELGVANRALDVVHTAPEVCAGSKHQNLPYALQDPAQRLGFGVSKLTRVALR